MSTTYAQTIDGNKIYAERSVQDKDGNQIDTTYAKVASLATVATSGDYNDLTNKPTIPSGSELVPSYSLPGDEGKVLTVGSSTTVWATPSAPNTKPVVAGSNIVITENTNNVSISTTGLQPSLPTISGHAGDVLTVNSQANAIEWAPSQGGTQVQADWAETSTSDPSYIQNKPTMNSLAAGSNISLNASGSTVTVAVTGLATVATSGDYGDLSNTPTIPSGTQLVPTATSADADKVLTVDSQGTPGWASAQAPISAGDGIDITNNVVSVVVASPLAINTDDEIWLKTGRGLDTQAGLQSDELEVRLSGTGGLMYDSDDDDGLAIQLAQYSGLEVQMNNGVQEGLNVLVDGTTIDKNSSGELTVIGGGGGTQADWSEADPTEPSYIENKPTPKTLTGGTNITVTENSSTITISATWQNAQADWTENDPTQPAYIQHKPTLSTVATTGAYSDLSGTPTVDQTYDGTSADAQSGVAVASGIAAAIAAAVIPISVVSTLPANPDPNTLYVVTGA